jgi:hypothetical protein
LEQANLDAVTKGGWTMCFYFRPACGWRDWDPREVNINGAPGTMRAADQKRIEPEGSHQVTERPEARDLGAAAAQSGTP